MNRSRFLQLGLAAAASLGTTRAGIHLSTPPGGDRLAAWTSRYRGSLRSDPHTVRVVASPALDELPGALRELEALVDGPLLCAGPRTTGSIDGRRILVRLRCA